MDFKILINRLIPAKKEYEESTGNKPYYVSMNLNNEQAIYDNECCPWWVDENYTNKTLGMGIKLDDSLEDDVFVFGQFEPSERLTELIKQAKEKEQKQTSIRDRINELYVEIERLEIESNLIHPEFNKLLEEIEKERGY